MSGRLKKTFAHIIAALIHKLFSLENTLQDKYDHNMNKKGVRESSVERGRKARYCKVNRH